MTRVLDQGIHGSGSGPAPGSIGSGGSGGPQPTTRGRTMTAPTPPTLAHQAIRLELPEHLGVHCLTAGVAGPPVVLLHGGGVDAAAFSWKYAIGALAGDHQVFAPDWPGYGESDRPDVEYTIEYYVEVLTQILDALHLPKAALVGLSMGGAAALGLALGSPDRVDRLVLADAEGLGDHVPGGHLGYLAVHVPGANTAGYALQRHSRWWVRQTLTSLVGTSDAVTDELVDEAFELLRRPGAGKAFHSTQIDEVGWRRLRTDYSDRLADLAVPTLIVHGEADPLVPVAWARRARERIPGSRLVTLPGVGHLSPREAPAAFNTAVTDFLADRAPTA
jgi:pimeloyl-ACP methyl ester carboxylesterase